MQGVTEPAAQHLHTNDACPAPDLAASHKYERVFDNEAQVRNSCERVSFKVLSPVSRKRSTRLLRA